MNAAAPQLPDPAPPEAPSAAAPARAWLAVASVALGTFAMVSAEFLPIGLLGVIARDMGVAEGRAGLMVSMPGIVAAVAAPATALLAGRIDRRTLLLALSALILASSLVAALAGGFAVLLAARVLLGLGVGGFWAFAPMTGRRLVPGAGGERAVAVILAGISAGTVLGVPFATAVGNLLGWRNAFFAVALPALAAALLQLALLPRLPGAAPAPPWALPALARNRRLLAGFTVTALVAGGHFAAYTYLEPFLSRISGLGGGAIGATLAAYGLAGVAGTFAGERLVRLGAGRAFTGIALLLALAIGANALAGAHAREAVTLVTLWGLAFGAVPVAVQAWIFHAAPRHAETASALVVTVFQLALAAGAAGGGWLVDHGGLAAAHGAGALAVLIAALIAALPLARPAGARRRSRISPLRYRNRTGTSTPPHR